MNRGMSREKTRVLQCCRAGPEVRWGTVGAWKKGWLITLGVLEEVTAELILRWAPGGA